MAERIAAALCAVEGVPTPDLAGVSVKAMREEIEDTRALMSEVFGVDTSVTCQMWTGTAGHAMRAVSSEMGAMREALEAFHIGYSRLCVEGPTDEIMEMLAEADELWSEAQ